jgi:hypothetical protein
MDITDSRTYPDYLARDLDQLITVATTDIGPEEVAVLDELADDDTRADELLLIGLGFGIADDTEWLPLHSPLTRGGDLT